MSDNVVDLSFSDVTTVPSAETLPTARAASDIARVVPTPEKTDNNELALDKISADLPAKQDEKLVEEKQSQSPEQVEVKIDDLGEKKANADAGKPDEHQAADDGEPPMKKGKPTVVESTSDALPDVTELGTPVITGVKGPQIVDLSENVELAEKNEDDEEIIVVVDDEPTDA